MDSAWLAWRKKGLSDYKPKALAAEKSQAPPPIRLKCIELNQKLEIALFFLYNEK